MWYFLLAQRSIPESFVKNNSLFKNLKKKSELTNSPIFNSKIQKLWGFFCIICKNVRLKLLVGNYMTQLVWISLAEMKKQFSVNATSMTKTSILQIFTDFCKIVKICPGDQKWVEGPNEWGPNESGAHMRIGPKCVLALIGPCCKQTSTYMSKSSLSRGVEGLYLAPLAPDREMVMKFDTIAKKYIKFNSFLWAFTWCYLKLESYGDSI